MLSVNSVSTFDKNWNTFARVKDIMTYSSWFLTKKMTGFRLIAALGLLIVHCNADNCFVEAPNECSCVSNTEAQCNLVGDACFTNKFDGYIEKLTVYGRLCPGDWFDLQHVNYGTIILRDESCSNEGISLRNCQ